MQNTKLFITSFLLCLSAALTSAQSHAAACSPNIAATAAAPCDCGTPAASITSGFCVDGQALQMCQDGVAATASCICGIGSGAVTMESGRTCTGGSVVALPAPTPVDVTGYSWNGPGPQVLRTSQVFGGSERQSCGDQNFEICVGPATKEGSTKIIKCFIPRNSTTCPTTISAAEQCSIANETPATAAGQIPACDRRHPERDNTSRGCRCTGFVYHGSSIIKRNRAECVSLMRQRIAQHSARCARHPGTSGCPAPAPAPVTESPPPAAAPAVVPVAEAPPSEPAIAIPPAPAHFDLADSVRCESQTGFVYDWSTGTCNPRSLVLCQGNCHQTPDAPLFPTLGSFTLPAPNSESSCARAGGFWYANGLIYSCHFLN